MIHLVKRIVDIKPYQLKLEFNTGEVLWVDLEKSIKSKSNFPNSIYKPLLDPDYFSSVKLQPEWETIYWENGLDFCPDVLYMMAKNIPFKHNDEA